MKKRIFCLILLISVALLSGCHKITDLNGIEKSIFEVNEVAVYKGIHYRITEVKYLTEDEYDFELENPNNVFLAIKFEIVNNSKEKYCVNDVESLLTVDDKDIEEGYVRFEPEDISKRMYYINPGEVYSQTDYLEISPEAKEFEFRLIIDHTNDIEINVNLRL